MKKIVFLLVVVSAISFSQTRTQEWGYNSHTSHDTTIYNTHFITWDFPSGLTNGMMRVFPVTNDTVKVIFGDGDTTKPAWVLPGTIVDFNIVDRKALFELSQSDSTTTFHVELHYGR